MNASHEWLKEFVPHGLTPAEVRDLLTARVATVDALEPLRVDLAPFVVARVATCAPHPDSDHLSVTTVDDGSGTLLDVVCGAPNVRAGAVYPFARVGTVMPGGLQIEKRKIRGATSQGMLCSSRELGLGEDHEGILELETDAAPGTPLLEVLAVGDTRFVIDVLPNRPDLLSHLGIARELAAATDLSLDPLAGRGPELTEEAAASLRTAAAEGPSAVARLLEQWERAGDQKHVVRGGDAPAGSPPSGTGKRETTTDGVRVAIDDPDGCPRFTGAVIRGVKIGPSPDWLRARVESVGGRSINNIVDVTNYMLHGFGQPMHAYDLARLAGPAIVARRARPGERLTTLDGVERKLTEAMTVIADADRAVGIGGVMGGRDSEVSEGTTDVFLEAAAFSARGVRATRRALGMSTDASYLFERGTDEESVAVWLQHAVHLILEVAGGSWRAWHADVWPAPREPASISLHAERVQRVIGVPIPQHESAALLESVGFEIAPETGSGALTVAIPSWRRDVTRDVDLIEEVARLHGYDRLPNELRAYRPGTVPDAPMSLLADRLRDVLAGAGLYEVRPMPFVGAATTHVDTSVPTQAADHVRVANPLAEDEPFLRNSLLESLARRAEYNLHQMQGDVRLFEIGNVFFPFSAEAAKERGATDDQIDRWSRGLPIEETRVGIVVMGRRRPPHFSGDTEPPAFDAWDAKEFAELVAAAAWPTAAIRLTPVSEAGDGRPPDAPFRTRRLAGALWRIERQDSGDAGTVVGEVRRLSIDKPMAWVNQQPFGIELSLGLVDSTPVAPRGTEHRAPEPATPFARHLPRYRTIPTQPAVDVDLALIVRDGVAAAAVEDEIRRASGELLERVVVFDEFRDEAKWPAARSIGWRLTFRHPERTLREKEIDGRRSKILKSLESALGVRARA